MLNEALYCGIVKMFKTGNSQIKSAALELVSKFIMGKNTDGGEKKENFEEDFSSLKRIKEEGEDGEPDKEVKLRTSCLFYYYKVMATDTDEMRLKAVTSLAVVANDPDQNLSLLVERLKDSNFGIRVEMIKQLKSYKIYFSKLTNEDIFQIVTYCIQTRDLGRTD